jgi:mono/diheme cytochrome c family protein
MRERWARWLAGLTALLVLGLAAGFAGLQNRAPIEPPAAASGEVTTADPEQVARGRALFESEGCQRCHSVAGVGSPRSPLDGVAAELTAAELRDWMVGDPAVADGLSSRALSAKQAYQDLPAEQIADLVAYLETLH